MAVKDNGGIDLSSVEITKIVDQYSNWDQRVLVGMNKTDIGIKIEIWDNNRYGKDEFIGFCYIPIDSIIINELSSRILDTKQNNISFFKEQKIKGTNGSNQIFKKGNRKMTNRVKSQTTSERKLIYQISPKQSGKTSNSNLIENLPKHLASQIIKLVHVDPYLEPETPNFILVQNSFDLLKGEILRESSDDVQLLEKTASIDTNDSENYHGKWLRSKGKLFITNFRFVYISRNNDKSPKTIMVNIFYNYFIFIYIFFFTLLVSNYVYQSSSKEIDSSTNQNLHTK